MVNHKKYHDIERFKANFIDGFRVGDHVVIQEKIDGANCAIRYDAETNTVVAQSRKNILDTSNTLRGFYEWARLLDVDKVRKVLGDNLILFGEWLVPHSVKYPEDKYNKAYFYDVYDIEKQEYHAQFSVQKTIGMLGLNYVPVFYDGEFTSMDDCLALVGKTEMGGEFGEGIVIKNQTRLNDPNTRLPYYVKIVGEQFCETKGHKDVKPVDPDELARIEANKALAATIVTEARVTKLLHKFVDEGILAEDWDIKDMGTVAKHLTKAVFEDCLKEEPDTVAQVENFGKVANSISMAIAKKIAGDR